MYIYAIGTDNIQKIGFSSNVAHRLHTLQTGNSEQLKIHHMVEIPEERVRIVEKTIHKEYNYLRVRGEWFKMSPHQAKMCIEHAAIRWSDDPLL